jgi:hypothetical protein
MEATTSSNASITFYMPNKLKIQRSKIKNLERNLKNPLNNIYQVKQVQRKEQIFELNPSQKYNLMIEGLGLISIKGVNLIEFNTFNTVGVTLLEN